MSTALVTQRLTEAGQAANQVAASHVFAEYQMRKAENTTRRQDADLVLFMRYLSGVGATPGDLTTLPEAWQGITWGLVKGFVTWQLQAGFAVSSVNVRLSTVKTYAGLAFQSGALTETESMLISAVKGYRQQEARNVDADRMSIDLPTRLGHKKSDPVTFDADQAQRLKAQPDTPQGRRDAVIVHLLLDHGLRVSELAELNVGDIDLVDCELKFYSPKTDKTQNHALTNGTLKALRVYLQNDALAVGALIRTSRKDGRLHDAGMSTRRISQRVKVLGQRVGIDGLSAHDCRHYAATKLAKTKDTKELMDIFGWASPAMAVRYQEAAKVISVE